MPLIHDADDHDIPTLSERLMALTAWTLLLLALGMLPFLIFVPGADYGALQKPEWRLPLRWYTWIWGGLYASMAAALWLMRQSSEAGDPRRRRAHLLFMAQYGLHLLWAPLLFRLGGPLPSSVLLAVILLVMLATLDAFRRLRLLSACLLLPWLLWLAYSLVLLFTIWRINAPA